MSKAHGEEKKKQIAETQKSIKANRWRQKLVPDTES